ncbi:succinate dehydrogenase subunit 5, mitochondrial [Olea europaea var. sylvestris]|uniref:succinate dehydrogenase subunit 5, mitochondrial n=1 Tax=Olea europaea var. sylvestris TaxID=158386 RepID=UPI000C1D689E|nr:succinate dehydrogenase subunit 5, mitochondrial [Olea europaea var. sylvestris]
MEKLVLMRSLCRSICRRSQALTPTSAVVAAATSVVNHDIRRLHFSSPALPTSFHDHLPYGYSNPLAMRIGGTRSFSEDVAHMPVIKDPEIERAFKDLMATNWDELPPAVVHGVKKALSKNTDDKAAQEALTNVFRAAEAVEEFTGILMSLKMEMDDAIGMSGEDVKPMPEEYVKAMRTIFDRYAAYLDAFGPEESYLKKKVENELGTKMIYLKMRCSGLDSEWGKVSVLGTSGISGSYVEQRA